jgi:NOL1/NOP2/fmu family ribosome biogenesis protein
LSEKLFPHKVRGEGHFMAVLEKDGIKTPPETERTAIGSGRKNKGKSVSKDKDVRLEVYDDFCDTVFGKKFTDDAYKRRLTFFGDNMYLLPVHAPELKGLKAERPGLQIGVFKTDGRNGVRFEPSHALALSLKADEVRNVVNITTNEAVSYIQGMTLNCNSAENGWVLMCVEGLSLGWGKLVNGTIKNHYPKGLRKILSS